MESAACRDAAISAQRRGAGARHPPSAPSHAAFRRRQGRMRTLTPETTTAALWRPSVRAFARRCAARVLLRVTLAELVDAAAGIHDLVLARVERVRGLRPVALDQRVPVAVFPLDRFFASKGRPGRELQNEKSEEGRL